MTKIAYNRCFGGFGLSDQAFELLLDKKGIVWEKRKGRWDTEYWSCNTHEEPSLISEYDYCEDEKRSDPDLIAVIEELGEASWGSCAALAIRELPSGTRYRISEYDGAEAIVTEAEHNWIVA